MNCDYTSPGGTPLERLAQQQAGTHPAPCARSCEANAYEIQIRQLSSERDAMAAKLAELEGQEPVAWQHRNGTLSCRCPEGQAGAYWVPLYARPVPAEPVNARLLDALSALLDDIEALIGESAGVYGLHLNGDVSPWSELEEGGRFERLSSMSRAREAIAAAAHTEPVNTQLLEALKRAKDSLVAFKFLPGDANRWEESDEENLAAVNSAIAAAEAQQERLLQDMHDAGREIDRVMAEAAPKAPQVDFEAIARAIWNVRRKEEDRCDMELEDLGTDHSVWEEASEVASILEDAGIEVA